MSEKYKVTGTIYRIDDTKQVSDKFSKREFSINVADGKYEQTVLLQATGDRCAELDQFRAGDEVSVMFNLRGRRWTGKDGVEKVFNSLDAWKIERVGAAKATSPGYDPGGPPQDDINW